MWQSSAETCFESFRISLLQWREYVFIMLTKLYNAYMQKQTIYVFTVNTNDNKMSKDMKNESPNINSELHFFQVYAHTWS